MDQTLKALSLTSGNLKSFDWLKTAANLHSVSKEIARSNEAKLFIDKDTFIKAKKLYKQINSEHASIFPAEGLASPESDDDPDFIPQDHYFSDLEHKNLAAVSRIKRGDYLENLDESDGERSHGVYQFDGETFEKVDYETPPKFELITQFRNPSYFYDYYVIIDTSFINDQGNGATTYGYYGYIPKNKVTLQNITPDDINIAKIFKNQEYPFTNKIEYNGLVYFINIEEPDIGLLRRSPEQQFIYDNYYTVDVQDSNLILAYVLNPNSFGKKKVNELKYLKSLIV